MVLVQAHPIHGPPGYHGEQLCDVLVQPAPVSSGKSVGSGPNPSLNPISAPISHNLGQGLSESQDSDRASMTPGVLAQSSEWSLRSRGVKEEKGHIQTATTYLLSENVPQTRQAGTLPPPQRSC